MHGGIPVSVSECLHSLHANSNSRDVHLELALNASSYGTLSDYAQKIRSLGQGGGSRLLGILLSLMNGSLSGIV